MYLEWVRLSSLSPVAVALVVGGVALAQPAGVTEPWSGGTAEHDSWFAPPQGAPALPPSPELLEPWANPADAHATPAIAQVNRDASRAAAPVVAPLGSPVDVSVVNPWAPPVAASETPSLRAAAPLAVNRAPATPWSPGFDEVVDPWTRMPAWAPSERVRLVLDPWAR
jgi:hypothetical protein